MEASGKGNGLKSVREELAGLVAIVEQTNRNHVFMIRRGRAKLRVGFTLIGLMVYPFLTVVSVTAGSLSGSYSPIATGSNVDLSAVGRLDWVHWGLQTETSLNRKACVAPLIGDFGVLQYAAVYQYSDNFNGYSWSDGSPVPSVTNTTTGVWAYGRPNLGTGFQLDAPADTTPKILQLFVGAYAAKGEFQARLSDGSAPAFVSGPNSTVSNRGNGPGGVFTLRYAANSAGQSLTVTWSVSQIFAADGNVTMQAASLSAPDANSPPFVLLTNPANNTIYTVPANMVIGASAHDLDGAITQVEFFAGTNKLGEATATPYTCTWHNAPLGHHYLLAAATDDSGTKSWSAPVEIFVCGSGGYLTGAVATPPLTVDLTTEGIADWAHWGLTEATSFDCKRLDNRKISNFTVLGTNTVQRYADNLTGFSWSDGTPTAAVAGTTTGVFIPGLTNGFQITASADTNLRRLKVYVGCYGAQGNLQAYLSDLSAAAFIDTSLSNLYGNSYAVYTLDYAAASAGQTVIVLIRSLNLYDLDFGNVTLQAATLQGPADPLPVCLLNPARKSTQFTFSFLSQSNRTYTVQTAPGLNPVIWQEATNLQGNGEIVTVTNKNVMALQTFFRVLTH